MTQIIKICHRVCAMGVLYAKEEEEEDAAQ